MAPLDGKRVVIEARIHDREIYLPSIVFHLAGLIAEFYPIRILIEYVKNRATYIRSLSTHPTAGDSVHSQKVGCKIYSGGMLSGWMSRKLDKGSKLDLYIFFPPRIA